MKKLVVEKFVENVCKKYNKSENLVVKEICKNLKWYERIIVKMFKKIFLKVYHNQRIKMLNILFKK